MLKRLAPPVAGMILDMDGVLWKDMTPIGDLPKIFARAQAGGLRVVLATNNGTMTVGEYLQKLRGFGVSLEPWQIVTSAQASAYTLAKAFPKKGSVFVVGESGVVEALQEAGFRAITDPEDEASVLAVVAGIDRGLTYAKLRRATFHIRGGARFYGTNPDTTFPTPEGLVPGAGSVLAALQAAAGVEPIVIGKPSPFLFELAAQQMQLPISEILVVGDRLETDIAGGQRLGARTALVLSGVSTPAQADAWQPKPDIVAANLGEVVGA